jgi:hypothetical protein
MAVLIYLALDLSLASMPGAFEFDACDSVETVQPSRAQDPHRPLTALIRDPRSVVTVQPTALKRHVVDAAVPLPPWTPSRAGGDRSHTARDLAPPSEDSH